MKKPKLGQWNRSALGTRLAKLFRETRRKMLRAEQRFIRKTTAGDEYVDRPFAERRPELIRAENEIGERYDWTLTPANVHEAIAEIEELTKRIPPGIIDERLKGKGEK